MDYQLKRTLYDPLGTFGQLIEGSATLCLTIELPWLDNHPQTSCIPLGNYIVQRFVSPRHGWVWLIENVPGRSMIELHPANTIKDLLGCVGVGDKLGVIEGFPAVLNSRKTFDMLKTKLPNRFNLEIL